MHLKRGTTGLRYKLTSVPLGHLNAAFVEIFWEAAAPAALAKDLAVLPQRRRVWSAVRQVLIGLCRCCFDCAVGADLTV